VKEFNRMEVGEGPGAVMGKMIELQKKPAPSEGVATDIASAKPPAQENKALPPDIPLSSPTVTEREPTPVPAPGKMTSSPVAASPKPPAPVPAKKERVPVASSVKSLESPPTINTPMAVAAPVEPPVPATPTKDPATGIASTRRAAPTETAVPPAPAVSPQQHKETEPQASFSLTKRPPATPRTAKPAAEDYTGGSKYRIGPEDILHIDVWGNPELTRDATVRPDGKISLPLIQDIQAEGRTASELSDVIRQRLLVYIKDPEVAVIVTEINAPKIFVIGYVTKPGPYPLRGEMSVLQALSLAGGFTPFASPKKIKVLRNNGGKREIHKINYYDMIDEGSNYFLKPGDTIVVP
jgi:polysaccharide export outer membrane protein